MLLFVFNVILMLTSFFCALASGVNVNIFKLREWRKKFVFDSNYVQLFMPKNYFQEKSYFFAEKW
jgi:hypothetical protein